MRKSLAPDLPRMALALVAAAVVLINAGSLLAIIAGALLGLLLRLPPQDTPSFALHFGISKRGGLGAAAAFVAILLLLPANAWLGTHTGAVLGLAPSGAGIGGGAVYGKSGREALSVFSAFYRTGAMVFGGGHVVLPLLENAVVARGWVDQQSFLAGYGAAQALPGPLFTFAAYLGAAIQPTPNRVVLSALALAAIFLPGLLLIVAVLPFWNGLRQHPRIQSSLRGVNAAVLGILVAAFVRPVWSSAVHTVFDVGLAISALALLVRWKLPPWILVVTMASVSAIAAAFLS
jgi:chromate transporter